MAKSNWVREFTRAAASPSQTQLSWSPQLNSCSQLSTADKMRRTCCEPSNAGRLLAKETFGTVKATDDCWLLRWLNFQHDKYGKRTTRVPLLFGTAIGSTEYRYFVSTSCTALSSVFILRPVNKRIPHGFPVKYKKWWWRFEEGEGNIEGLLVLCEQLSRWVLSLLIYLLTFPMSINDLPAVHCLHIPLAAVYDVKFKARPFNFYSLLIFFRLYSIRFEPQPRNFQNHLCWQRFNKRKKECFAQFSLSSRD